MFETALVQESGSDFVRFIVGDRKIQICWGTVTNSYTNTGTNLSISWSKAFKDTNYRIFAKGVRKKSVTRELSYLWFMQILEDKTTTQCYFAHDNNAYQYGYDWLAIGEY